MSSLRSQNRLCPQPTYKLNCNRAARLRTTNELPTPERLRLISDVVVPFRDVRELISSVTGGFCLQCDFSLPSPRQARPSGALSQIVETRSAVVRHRA